MFPELSIIVPVYNGELFLQKCLCSIKNQSFHNFECIIVDDGSSDGSEAIYDFFIRNDCRFKVIKQQNAGVSVARNAGIKNAKGQWVSFVDSDDWIDIDTYEYVMNIAKTNDFDVIQWGVRYTFNNMANGSEFMYQKEWNPTSISIPFWSHAPYTKLIRNDFIKKNKILFPVGITVAEDLYFIVQCYLNTTRICNVKKVFYNYFQNNSSAMFSMNKKKCEDVVKIVKAIENKVVQDHVEKKWKKCIFEKKISAKNNYLLYDNSRDYDLWKKTFSEINHRLLFSLDKKVYIYICIFLKLYKFVDFIFFIKNRIKK